MSSVLDYLAHLDPVKGLLISIGVGVGTMALTWVTLMILEHKAETESYRVTEDDLKERRSRMAYKTYTSDKKLKELP